MSSMSISSSIKTLTTKTTFKSFPNPIFLIKPLNLLFPHSFTLSKSISFQKLTTKPQCISSSQSSSLQPIENLPSKLQEIIKLFQSNNNPRAKYQQLLFYATNLPPLDEKFKVKENKVEGCVSQVWVRAFLDENKVYYEADSDSIMTKGLAALLVLGLSGQTINDIVQVTPDFVTLLGLQQNLTPSRNNGFLNMLRLMQRKALFLGLEAEKKGSFQLGSESFSRKGGVEGVIGLNEVENGEKGLNFEGGIVNGEKNSSFDTVRVENGEKGSSQLGSESFSRKGGVEEENGEKGLSFDDLERNLEGGIVNGEKNSSFDTSRVENDGVNEEENVEKRRNWGSRGERIREVLEKELKPIELKIEDVSYQHAGHSGVKGSDGETHFNLKIVSNEFQGKSLVKRHRIIYGLLENELQSGLHALSIIAKTPIEVEEGR